MVTHLLVERIADLREYDKICKQRKEQLKSTFSRKNRIPVFDSGNSVDFTVFSS